jgi:hypothetical protein
MKRIRIDNEIGDPTGRWFDPDKAQCHKENTWWNGSNHISKATGSQWRHEAIWITKSGVLILNTWSECQDSKDTYEIVDMNFASAWFVDNEYSDEQLPGIFKEGIAALEVL